MLTVIAILGIAIVFAFVFLQYFAVNRARSQRGQVVESEVLRPLRVKSGRPALLYFTSDTCSMCRIQEQEMAGWKPDAVQFVRVDVAKHLDIARRFSIMGTPSFVLLDADRRIREVLVGRQPLHRLQALTTA